MSEKQVVKHIHSNLEDNSDSFEAGSVAKGSKIKVYGNADDVEGFKKKINNMIEIKKYAKAQLDLSFN